MEFAVSVMDGMLDDMDSDGQAVTFHTSARMMSAEAITNLFGTWLIAITERFPDVRIVSDSAENAVSYDRALHAYSDGLHVATLYAHMPRMAALHANV